MKLIRGKTLADMLKTTPLGSPELLRIFEQIVETVAFAHSKQVIHRDLKPANIMVGTFAEVQVMDWGLAKILSDAPKSARHQLTNVSAETEPSSVLESYEHDDSATQAGSLLGTPAYMPPEQARGDLNQISYTADVFALGAVLCELLTGKAPYVGNFQTVRAMAIIGQTTDAVERLSTCGADAELIAICQQCLQSSPDDRPSDAQNLAQLIRSYRLGVESRLRQAELERAEALVRETENIKRRRLRRVLAGSLLFKFKRSEKAVDLLAKLPNDLAIFGYYDHITLMMSAKKPEIFRKRNHTVRVCWSKIRICIASGCC
jgi:eukaryotic-like serine/threonine-protein kinase